MNNYPITLAEGSYGVYEYILGVRVDAPLMIQRKLNFTYLKKVADKLQKYQNEKFTFVTIKVHNHLGEVVYVPNKEIVKSHTRKRSIKKKNTKKK